MTAMDARHVPPTRAQRLAADAAEAAQLRAYAEHPDVVALRVERIRRQTDLLMWGGILLGLAFTMVNVQTFAAQGAAVWSLPWLVAWLLDPMVSVVLIAVLRAEQVTARYQVATGRWTRATKWFAFAATYLMNTWQSWAALSAAGIVLHSVPPLLVYLASETAPALRDRLTEAVHRAAHQRMNTTTNGAVNGAVNGSASVHDPATRRVPEPAHERGGAVHGTVAAPAARSRRRAGQTGKGRRSRADYLAQARAAWAPDIEVTPAWVREMTGCSRGLSSTLAAQLRAEHEPTTTEERAA